MSGLFNIKPKLKNYLHLHLLVLIAGFTAILGKEISISAIPLVWFRMSMAAILMLLFILLKGVNLFDVYQGKNLPKGKKSYAVSFTLQDEHKTLNEKQIDKIMSKLQSNFENQLGAELR